MKKPWVLGYPLSTQRRLILLGRCPVYARSTDHLLRLSCCGSKESSKTEWWLDMSFPVYTFHHTYSSLSFIWAATWQNQQNECAPSEDSDQPGHPPRLIRVFAVRMKKPWVLSYPLSAQWRVWSDWADAGVFAGHTLILLVLSCRGSFHSNGQENMSLLMRLWYFLSFVNAFFKRACAFNQWGYMIFGRALRLLPYFMCANREGSGETARMHRPTWAFAACWSPMW